MTIHFESAPGGHPPYPTGVSLHSHTNHSRESLSFIYRYVSQVQLLRTLAARFERQYQSAHPGSHLDFHRGWWTPPLSPRDALQLERDQLERRLGLQSLVSLSDHDDIEAGMALSVLDDSRNVPVSVEWTVPYRGTFFHLGIHNLPRTVARQMMARLTGVTQKPEESAIHEALSEIAGWRDTLIVFNHPCWDESRVGIETHQQAMLHFGLHHVDWLHALEINGLRPWTENQAAVRFSEYLGLPVISGGDRHALEPNVVLNLTRARTFEEFTAEVRDGESQVLITRQYEQPSRTRLLRSIAEIVDEHWMHRVFYACDDGITRSANELFQNEPPLAVRLLSASAHILKHGVRILRVPGLAPSKSEPC